MINRIYVISAHYTGMTVTRDKGMNLRFLCPPTIEGIISKGWGLMHVILWISRHEYLIKLKYEWN